MNCVDHRVWATPPGEKEQVFIAAFDLDRWQWAEKLAQSLADSGYRDVEIRLQTGHDEEE